MSLELARRSFGEGPPVVVLHGLLGASRNWQGLAKALGRRFRVITADLRNHGTSPWDASVDYAAMAGDVAALMEAEGLERAHLVGHSMGGKVAMALALTQPQRVDRLIVVDIAPVAYDHGHEELIGAMRGVDLGAMRRRDDVDRALAGAVPDQATRAFLLQNLETDPAEGLRWRPNLAILESNMAVLTGWPDDLAGRRHDGPALFLRGGRSGYVDQAHEPAITAQFPGARIETIDGAGHWVHAEAPAAFLEAAEAFLGG